MTSLQFSALKEKFQGDLVTPEEETYADAISRWAANAVRPAKIVAFVKDKEDVALTIQYATSNGLPIAIRCGGHGHNGSSSTDGGLVIDLSRYLNKVRVDPEAKLAYVGGGAIWETLEKEAIKFGLAAVGGGYNHSGIGGVTLGGGYGWLSAEHGLVVDNLVQATVVNTVSTFTASETENPDLFFGIRGGGSNFGVVTEFVFRLHEQAPTVFAGPIIFLVTPEVIEKLVEMVNTWAKNASVKESALLTVTRCPDGVPVFVFFVFFNGSEQDGRERFKEMYKIGHVRDMSKEMPYEMVGATKGQVPWGRNYFFRGVSATHLTVGALTSLVEHLPPKSQPGQESSQVDPAILYEFLIPTKFNTVPRGTTAFNSRGPQYNVLCTIGWSSQDPVAWAEGIIEQFEQDILKDQEPVSDDENSGYGNYEPYPTADKAGRLFGSNYERLQAVKTKYDPSNVFCRWFPIEPKSSL